jgi:hypothetical protein
MAIVGLESIYINQVNRNLPAVRMNTNFLLNPNYVSQAGLSLYNTLEKEYNLYFIAQYTLNIHARWIDRFWYSSSIIHRDFARITNTD